VTQITVNRAPDHFIFQDGRVGSLLGTWFNCIRPRRLLLTLDTQPWRRLWCRCARIPLARAHSGIAWRNNFPCGSRIDRARKGSYSRDTHDRTLLALWRMLQKDDHHFSPSRSLGRSPGTTIGTPKAAESEPGGGTQERGVRSGVL